MKKVDLEMMLGSKTATDGRMMQESRNALQLQKVDTLENGPRAN